MTDKQLQLQAAVPEMEAPVAGEGRPRVELLNRPRVFQRFNIHQRIQHFLLAFSFLGLMTTGMPLRFPELAIARIFIAMLGGVHVVGIIHRVLGVIMAISGAYHVSYLIVMYFKGYRGAPVLFGRGDGRLFLDDLKYFFGFSRNLPRFGRYNWREKFDYFGAAFGVALMVGTGLVIWFPQIVTLIFPGWIITASVLVHEYEALLAGLAIFLSHFYWVHLNREVYPMSMVWLSGEMSEHEMRVRHPVELEQILAREAKEQSGEAQEPSEPAQESAVQSGPAEPELPQDEEEDEA
jgi:formate dehydrogenase subunit gamma